MTATSERNGVRVTMRLEGPLAAGEAVTIRTRVRNVRQEPIWWVGGYQGMGVGARMPNTAWRLGDPAVSLPQQGEPGFPARRDLKNAITLYAGDGVSSITPDFEFSRAEGIKRQGGGDVGTSPERIPPGGAIDFVHRWDGFARVDEDQPGTVGLPPSGALRVTATAHYQLARDGEVRTTTTRLDTEIVDGWELDRLHPMEVVDAALADPAFAELMQIPDFNRTDAGVITFDLERDVWYVGSCGVPEGTDHHYMRLAVVDPFSGEVLELMEGRNDQSDCDPKHGLGPALGAVDEGPGASTVSLPSPEPS